MQQSVGTGRVGVDHFRSQPLLVPLPALGTDVVGPVPPPPAHRLQDEVLGVERVRVRPRIDREFRLDVAGCADGLRASVSAMQFPHAQTVLTLQEGQKPFAIVASPQKQAFPLQPTNLGNAGSST